MNFEIRQGGLEVRAQGRRLVGQAIRYGVPSDVAGIGPELFLPGAFGGSLADVLLLRQHDRRKPLARTGGGGLKLADSREALSFEAELVSTTDNDDVLELVRGGVLRGVSVGFKAREERRVGGVREISRADLLELSVVDSGAHETSLEARIREGRGIVDPYKPITAADIPKRTGANLDLFPRQKAAQNQPSRPKPPLPRLDLKSAPRVNAAIPFGRDLSCRCHRGECDAVIFDEGVFEESIAEGKNDILLVAGAYSRGLASVKRGTLGLRNTPAGLEVAAVLPNTAAVQELVEQSAGVPLVARPYFDEGVFEEVDGVARYKKARLRAIILGSTDFSGGWPEATVTPGEAVGKRLRLWL